MQDPAGQPEREPCATCGEPIPLEARACAHCGRSALVELRLPAPLADARQRYQVARALSALGGPFLAVGPLQQAMARKRPRVAGGLTRRQAYAGYDVLVAQGLEAEIAPASAPAGGGLKLVGGVALGMAALTFAGWWAFRPAARTPAKAVKAAASGSMTAAPAAAQSTPELTRNQLARIALASTVSLRCQDSVGAGFFVREGLLLTNAHVLCRGTDALKVALADGRQGTGTAVRRDDTLDIALVSVSGLDAPPLPMGDAGAVSVGDRVLMVGSPVGMDFTVHEGMVSAIGRVVLGAAYIQLDAKVNPGNSGGPLLDSRGRAVGIVSLKRVDAEGIALALPINYAWTGGNPMLDPPAAGSTGFDAMLVRAQQEDEALAGEVARAELRPLLMGLGMNAYRQWVARLLLPARAQPYTQDFSFTIWNGQQEVCSFTGTVTDWKLVENPALMRANPRLQSWLERRGLSAQLYTGEAPIRIEVCSQTSGGVQLELRGGEPGASRLVLQ